MSVSTCCPIRQNKFDHCVISSANSNSLGGRDRDSARAPHTVANSSRVLCSVPVHRSTDTRTERGALPSFSSQFKPKSAERAANRRGRGGTRLMSVDTTKASSPFSAHPRYRKSFDASKCSTTYPAVGTAPSDALGHGPSSCKSQPSASSSGIQKASVTISANGVSVRDLRTPK
jgi:hypothetical protein